MTFCCFCKYVPIWRYQWIWNWLCNFHSYKYVNTENESKNFHLPKPSDTYDHKLCLEKTQMSSTYAALVAYIQTYKYVSGYHKFYICTQENMFTYSTNACSCLCLCKLLRPLAHSQWHLWKRFFYDYYTVGHNAYEE